METPTSPSIQEYEGDFLAGATVGTKQAVQVSKEFQSGSQSRGGRGRSSPSVSLGTGATVKNAVGPLKDEATQKNWDSGDCEEIVGVCTL